MKQRDKEKLFEAFREAAERRAGKEERGRLEAATEECDHGERHVWSWRLGFSRRQYLCTCGIAWQVDWRRPL